MLTWIIIGLLGCGVWTAWRGGKYATDYRFIPHSFNSEGAIRWLSRFQVGIVFWMLLSMNVPHLAFTGAPRVVLTLLFAWLVPSAVMKAAIDLNWFRMRMSLHPGVLIPWFRPSTPWEIQRRQ